MEILDTTLPQEMNAPVNNFKELCRHRVLTLGYQWVLQKRTLKKRLRMYK